MLPGPSAASWVPLPRPDFGSHRPRYSGRGSRGSGASPQYSYDYPGQNYRHYDSRGSDFHYGQDPRRQERPPHHGHDPRGSEYYASGAHQYSFDQYSSSQRQYKRPHLPPSPPPPHPPPWDRGLDHRSGRHDDQGPHSKVC